MLRATAVTSAMLMTALAVREAAAQPPRWRFHYPEPPAAAVRVMRDVPFATVDSLTLSMDVYRPAGSSAAAPALIFYRPFNARRGPERRSNDWLRSWARVAAANGIVGIVADLRGDSSVADFGRLVPHLLERAARYGVDRERLAVFSGSGPVREAFPVVEDPRQTAIKAAVMYYGTGAVTAFRLDLPVLYVRAGLDHAGTNAEIVRLASLAASQNAPVTLLNHHSGHHAFEVADGDDDAATRQVIAETIDFVKRATSAPYQAALREKHLDAVAAGQLSVGNYHDAALTFAELKKRRPADSFLRFAYAQALMGDRQFGPACAEFRSFTPPSFAAIVPGSRSCVLAGTPDTALTFLRSIRRDWMQSEYLSALRTDSAFAPLWGRADFQALFQRPDSVGTPR